MFNLSVLTMGFKVSMPVFVSSFLFVYHIYLLVVLQIAGTIKYGVDILHRIASNAWGDTGQQNTIAQSNTI